MEESQHNNILCCRCGGSLETGHTENIDLQSIIKLNEREVSFIKSKFEGPLCVACLNQLKTSYRIVKGDYSLAFLKSLKSQQSDII